MALRSRFAARARERARTRTPTRAQRRAGALRSPEGAILRYRVALRQVAGTFGAVVRRVIVPELERFAPPPEARTDAADGDARDLVSKARAALVGAAGKVGPSAGTVGDRVVKHSKAEFKRIGINLRKEEPKFDKLITGWRRENVGLIESLIGRELDTIQALLADGEGRRVESLAGDIEERLRVTRSKAELLARDQVLKLNAKVTGERQQAAGIEEYIWTTSGDERVRERHADLDGEKFRWDDPPVTNEDGDRNHPGEDYQCRCTAYPVLPELEEAGNGGSGDEPPEPPSQGGDEPAPEPPDEFREGVHAQSVAFVGISATEGAAVLASLVAPELSLLRATPLGSLKLEQEVFRGRGRKKALLAGQYDQRTKQIRVTALRPPGSFGKDFVPGESHSISSVAKTRVEAAKRTLTHELGHHVHTTKVEADRIVADAFHRARGAKRFITRYASSNHFEYFAESYAAYRHQPRDLEAHDPNGFAMVRDVLRLHGE